jgi:predicted amidohydrolase
MKDLRISLIQPDTKWENPSANLLELTQKALNLVEKTDLVVLPEMFSTGFSMNPTEFGESNSGNTITQLKILSSKCNFAVVGSFIATQDGNYFNRGFFIKPDGNVFFL